MKNLLFLVLVAPFISVTAGAQAKETVAILGDSYSAYEGYLTPENNTIWYFKKIDLNRTDVTDVKQMWWWQVVKEGGYKLGVNNSFSGSTICYTGYDDEDYSARSFVNRVNNLGTPDIILIFGATNDSWAGVPLGEFKYENIKRADLYTFRPAVATILAEAQNRYPNARLLYIINSELSEGVTSSIKTICDHYGVQYLQLQDVDKQNGHPNIKGMKSIAKQVLKALKSGKS
ncbi:MAG: SGNH/GDSL hydrolase family protein [Prevotella sp.]